MMDCSPYFDTATLRVLEFLLFNQGEYCLSTYINEYVKGEPDVVHECISRIETTCQEDKSLMRTKKAGADFIKKHKDAVYERFRIY
jgi:hypothetical protein